MANHRAVSGVVGAVILGLTLLIAVAALVFLTSHFQNIASKAMETLQYRAQAAALAQSVTGWWLQQNSKLTINLTNNAAYTILVTTITIIHDDTSLQVLDKGDTVNITDCGPTGCRSYTSQLPTAIPATHTVNITVTVDKTVAQVSVTLSASPIVVAIPLKNYYQIYGNITVIAPPPQPQPQQETLQRLASAYTVTWGGKAAIGTIETRNGTVYRAENLTGNHLAGTPASLTSQDNDNYIVKAKASIQLERNTVLFYDDFSTDPFTDGRLINSPQNDANWTWDPNKQAIYANHYLYVRQVGDGVNTSLVTSLVFYNFSKLTISLLIEQYNISKIGFLYHIWYSGTVSIFSETLGVYTSAEAELVETLVYDFNTTDAYLDALFRRLNSTGGQLDPTRTVNATLLYSTFTSNLNYTILTLLEPDEVYYKLTNWVFSAGKHISILYNESNKEQAYASVVLVEDKKPESNSTIGFYVYTYGTARGATLQLWGVIIINLEAWVEANITYYVDNLVIAYGDPRFVNVSGVPVGSIVELWDGDVLVDRRQDGLNDTDGVADGVVQLLVIHHPIVRNPVFRVYDSQGNLLFEQALAEPVIGGQAYRFSYWVVFEAASQLDTTGLLRILDLRLRVLFNVSSDFLSGFSVMVYDWSLNRFVDVSGSCSLSFTGGWALLNCGLSPSHLNPDNATVVYRVGVAVGQPVDVAFDVANVVLEGVFSRGVSTALIVGVGGTEFIDFYQVDVGAGTLAYLYSVRAGSVFDGSVGIGYSLLGNLLVMVNGSGLYAVSPPAENWQPVTTGCRATGLGAVVEAVNTSTTVYAVVVPGSGNSSLCVAGFDPETLAVVDGPVLLGLPPGLGFTEYGVAASNGTLVYTVAVDSATGSAVLVEVDPVNKAVRVVDTNVPGSRILGLDYGGGRLWLILEGGSIYSYNFSTGTWSLLNVDLPFYPWSPGDRLEYYGGVLVFVRDDDTNEAWFIPT